LLILLIYLDINKKINKEPRSNNMNLPGLWKKRGRWWLRNNWSVARGWNWSIYKYDGGGFKKENKKRWFLVMCVSRRMFAPRFGDNIESGWTS